MKKIGYFIIVILVTLVISVILLILLKPNTKITKRYCNSLEKRIKIKLGVQIILPEIKCSEKIFSNAQYAENIIYLGNRFFSEDYFTNEDRLSILFHEYLHYINEKRNRYQCLKNKEGLIYQKRTDIFFTKRLSQPELNIDLKLMKQLEFSEKEIDQYKIESKIPVYKRFIYAPSNLSKDELFCYFAEKKCNEIGIFKHSKFYSDLIESRIETEIRKFKMRLQYESEHKLNPDGSHIH